MRRTYVAYNIGPFNNIIYIKRFLRLSEFFFWIFSDCKVLEPEPAAKDEEVSAQLWDTSCAFVNLEPSIDPFKPESGDL